MHKGPFTVRSNPTLFILRSNTVAPAAQNPGSCRNGTAENPSRFIRPFNPSVFRSAMPRIPFWAQAQGRMEVLLAAKSPHSPQHEPVIEFVGARIAAQKKRPPKPKTTPPPAAKTAPCAAEIPKTHAIARLAASLNPNILQHFRKTLSDQELAILAFLGEDEPSKTVDEFLAANEITTQAFKNNKRSISRKLNIVRANPDSYFEHYREKLQSAEEVAQKQAELSRNFDQLLPELRSLYDWEMERFELMFDIFDRKILAVFREENPPTVQRLSGFNPQQALDALARISERLPSFKIAQQRRDDDKEQAARIYASLQDEDVADVEPFATTFSLGSRDDSLSADQTKLDELLLALKPLETLPEGSTPPVAPPAFDEERLEQLQRVLELVHSPFAEVGQKARPWLLQRLDWSWVEEASQGETNLAKETALFLLELRELNGTRPPENSSESDRDSKSQIIQEMRNAFLSLPGPDFQKLNPFLSDADRKLLRGIQAKLPSMTYRDFALTQGISLITLVSTAKSLLRTLQEYQQDPEAYVHRHGIVSDPRLGERIRDLVEGIPEAARKKWRDNLQGLPSEIVRVLLAGTSINTCGQIIAALDLSRALVKASNTVVDLVDQLEQLRDNPDQDPRAVKLPEFLAPSGPEDFQEIRRIVEALPQDLLLKFQKNLGHELNFSLDRIRNEPGLVEVRGALANQRIFILLFRLRELQKDPRAFLEQAEKRAQDFSRLNSIDQIRRRLSLLRRKQLETLLEGSRLSLIQKRILEILGEALKSHSQKTLAENLDCSKAMMLAHLEKVAFVLELAQEDWEREGILTV